MSNMPHEQERLFALQRLEEAQIGILQGLENLVVLRAKIEKVREINPKRAHEILGELERVRNRLCGSLGEASLALQEMELFQQASISAQLQTGLRGFPLLSTNYRKIYDTIKSYGESLPTKDKANAAIIGRLMNNVKMGYYPTDLDNIQHILKGITFPTDVVSNLLDPCCGCGKALRHLAEGNHCYAYGVELDEYRAEDAQTRLHRVGVGSFFHSRISNDAFHVLLLNPPYLNVIGADGNRTRHEKRFLVDSICHVMYGGLLLYIIPYYRFTADICRILCDNFSDISVWQFTGDEFKKHKQVVVMGLRQRRIDGSAGAQSLEQSVLYPQNIPLITEIEEGRYLLPTTAKEVALFKGELFNEKELEQQLSKSTSFSKLMSHSSLDSANKRPLLPLSIGQIGLIGGSGMINGLIDCETPHIIKGRIIKENRVTITEQLSSRGARMGDEIKETNVNKMVFSVLTPNGFKALT